MRYQTHRPVPGEKRSEGPTDRYAVEPRIGEGNGLNGYSSDVSFFLRGAEQCGLERKRPITVSACSLREQDQRIAANQPFGYCVALDRGVAGLPVHKDCALQFGEPAEERPLGHLRFGDERTGNKGAEDRNVSVGDVICRKQCGALIGGRSDQADAKPEDSTTPAVIKGWQRLHPPATKSQPGPLYRH